MPEQAYLEESLAPRRGDTLHDFRMCGDRAFRCVRCGLAMRDATNDNALCPRRAE